MGISFLLFLALISPAPFIASAPTLNQLAAAQEEIHRNESIRKLGYFSSGVNYNYIDSCWAGYSDWKDDRQRLADCAVGFGAGTVGGKGGPFYVVNTTRDDPANPKPGMLRWGVTRYGPLWIVFKRKKMVFRLKEELIINSHKTLDGRGCNVFIAGPACIVAQSVEQVIIHNLHVYNCKPTGGNGRTMVMSTPDHVGWRGATEGDAVSLWNVSHVWVDHCYLASSTDGLIDAVEGSTHITISNNRLTRHDEAMLFGHSNSYTGDKGLKATFILNHFGPYLVQRIPRVRFGYVEVVNNLYEPWLKYAVGGSADATIKSTGNRYVASNNPNLKEVTSHLDASESEWKLWNWLSVNDEMVNGAFFRESGSLDPSNQAYAQATTLEAKDPADIESLVANSGPLRCHKNLQCSG